MNKKLFLIYFILFLFIFIPIFRKIWRRTHVITYKFNNLFYKNSNKISIYKKINYNPNDNKIISVSIWGDNTVYYKGLFKMCEDVNTIFPGWKVRIYCHYKISERLLKKLKKYNQQIFLVKQDNVDSSGECTFWRFLVAGDNVDFICRDVDYNLNKTDYNLTMEWLNNYKEYNFYKYQCISDNYISLSAIADFIFGYKYQMAGLWGGRKKCIPNILNIINNFQKRKPFGSDELFLLKYFDKLFLNKKVLIFYHKCISINKLKNKNIKLIKNNDSVSKYNY